MKLFVGLATCCLEVKMVRKRSCLAFLAAIKLKISVWLGSLGFYNQTAENTN